MEPEVLEGRETRVDSFMDPQSDDEINFLQNRWHESGWSVCNVECEEDRDEADDVGG